MRTLLLSLSILLLASLAPSTSWGASFPDRYDEEIQKAVRIYWSDFPFWKAWKAQLYQESRLDPQAVSPVGARGLAQFMPGTWTQIIHQLGWADVSPHMVAPAIHAGAYYDRLLRNQWSSPRPAMDRHDLALASYNAGLGNLLKAQGLCGMATRYADIIRCLPRVTGRFSRETIDYVVKIHRWWEAMR